MGSLGPMELGLIFLVVLLVFGAKRIPEIARGLGKGIREFKDATTDIKREISAEERANQRIQPPAAPTHEAAPPAAPTHQAAPPAARQESYQPAADPGTAEPRS